MLMTRVSFAEINGAACRYAVDGAGPRTLVLIHELGGSLDSWNDVVPLLPAGWRIVRHDLRGAGMSEKLRGVNDLDALAGDVAALLDHLGVDGPVVAVGAAMGAAVAVRLATRFPDRVGKLVLIGPALGVPAERREAARALTDRIETDGMRALSGAVLPRAFPDELWSSDQARSLAIARWLGADPEGYAANYRILVDQDLRPELARVACPTLVLAGRHDPFGTPEAIDAGTSALPQRSFATLDGGHFMSIQSPRVVAEALVAFLAD
jgi:3-oxoadipate enol-lactonase